MLKKSQNKTKYVGRVDFEAGLKGVAEVRKVIIEDLEKYQESSIEQIAIDVPPVELTNALVRHLAFVMEDIYSIDEETGLPHLYHAQFNLMVLAKGYQMNQEIKEALNVE